MLLLTKRNEYEKKKNKTNDRPLSGSTIRYNERKPLPIILHLGHKSLSLALSQRFFRYPCSLYLYLFVFHSRFTRYYLFVFFFSLNMRILCSLISVFSARTHNKTELNRTKDLKFVFFSPLKSSREINTNEQIDEMFKKIAPDNAQRICWRIWTSSSTKLLTVHLYTIFTYPNLIQKFKEELRTHAALIGWLQLHTYTYAYAYTNRWADDSHQATHEITSSIATHMHINCHTTTMMCLRSFLPTIVCVGCSIAQPILWLPLARSFEQTLITTTITSRGFFFIFFFLYTAIHSLVFELVLLMCCAWVILCETSMCRIELTQCLAANRSLIYFIQMSVCRQKFQSFNEHRTRRLVEMIISEENREEFFFRKLFASFSKWRENAKISFFILENIFAFVHREIEKMYISVKL